MNATQLRPNEIPGFKIIPKRRLGDICSRSQNTYYILLQRRGPHGDPRERVFFVHYLDHFLDACQRQIRNLWEKHRVLITHVAIGENLPPAHGDLAALYDRAVTVHQLRDKLQPRFRRL